MKYTDKLENFVGKEGRLLWTDVNRPYITFYLNQEGFLIQEVGDDYVVIQINDNKNLLFIPLNLLVLYYPEVEIDDSRKILSTEQHVGSSSLIYIYKNNQRFGPYEESVVKRRLQDGQYSQNDLGLRNGMKDWQPLSSLFPMETKNQGLADIKPFHAPATFSFTLANLIRLSEVNIEGPISYLLETNSEYKAKREQTKKESARHLNTILATKIWSPYEIKSYYWFSADRTDTHLNLSFDLFTIPAPIHANYTVGRVHFEIPLNAADGQVEKSWISIISEEEIQENIKMLNEE